MKTIRYVAAAKAAAICLAAFFAASSAEARFWTWGIYAEEGTDREASYTEMFASGKLVFLCGDGIQFRNGVVTGYENAFEAEDPVDAYVEDGIAAWEGEWSDEMPDGESATYVVAVMSADGTCRALAFEDEADGFATGEWYFDPSMHPSLRFDGFTAYEDDPALVYSSYTGTIDGGELPPDEPALPSQEEFDAAMAEAGLSVAPAAAGFEVAFVAPVDGTYVLAEADTPNGPFVKNAATAKDTKAGESVTLVGDGTADAKFFKVGIAEK
ncbi:MAG: hypothetical protein IJ678_03695 [Kiritimatiellae bacterium]|nr:hypothetical protein [Kiritimatiellia bacterium]